MYAAILYDRGENFVKIALRDPSDLRVLDELFFVVGKKIVVGVAPEVRIYQALEKYYGKLRTPRFAILAEKLSRPEAAPAPRRQLLWVLRHPPAWSRRSASRR